MDLNLVNDHRQRNEMKNECSLIVCLLSDAIKVYVMYRQHCCNVHGDIVYTKQSITVSSIRSGDLCASNISSSEVSESLCERQLR